LQEFLWILLRKQITFCKKKRAWYHRYCSTLCLKKVPTFKLSLTLSNLIGFKIFVLLESVWNVLRSPYDITHLTLGMLIHYLGELQIQIFCRCERKRKQIAFLIASDFVIYPQILIFVMFKIASLPSCWLQTKFSISLFFLLFTFAINLWHRKCVLSLQNRENGAILPFPRDARKLQGFQLQGASAPNLPPGTLPLDPHGGSAPDPHVTPNLYDFPQVLRGWIKQCFTPFYTYSSKSVDKVFIRQMNRTGWTITFNDGSATNIDLSISSIVNKNIRTAVVAGVFFGFC